MKTIVFKIGIGLIILILVSILLFHKIIFNVEHTIIEGNTYLPREEIVKNLPLKYDLFSLKKLKVEQSIFKNPYIQNVKLKIIFPKTLIIKIKEKELISRVLNEEIRYLISKEYEFLPWFFDKELEKLPLILTQKNLLVLKSQAIIEKLAIIKSEKPELFAKIAKIDLRNVRKTNIFMTSGREYQFFYNPELKDFLKIQILEKKVKMGKKILVKGDAIIIY